MQKSATEHRNGQTRRVTPAMEAGVSNHVSSVEEIVTL
jgi:hypothetical protein